MTAVTRPSPARVAAAKALKTVAEHPEALAADALAQAVVGEGLSPEDQRLARMIVYGVLRTALTLDHLYGRHLTRRAESLSLPARTLLRMATYQHFYLEKIPGYAIVHDAVELGRRVFRLPQREVGFLNAVLRKVTAENAPPEQLLPSGNRASSLAVRYSFPPEIVRLLIAKYGGSRAVALMEQCNREPVLTLRTNTLKGRRHDLIDRLRSEGFAAREGLLAPEAVIVDGPLENPGGAPGGTSASLFATEAFRAGLFYVQDEASQMVAHVARPWARGRVLDLCAAPGGKTTHLAELTGGRLSITATDSSPRRLELVKENLERLETLGVIVRELEEVLAETGPQAEGYDLILVDAPCSGLGTVRRNPEVRYRITPEGLARHQERQLEVLCQALPLLRPGGALVYSTCSISNEENQQVMQQLLKEKQELTRAAAAAGETAGAIWQEKHGAFQTWPQWLELDGFEAAVLVRATG